MDGMKKNPVDYSFNAHVEQAVDSFMERLGGRLGELEVELRYAWRAVDLLSQEYVKMWEKLERLEILLYEQQAVIAQLLSVIKNNGREGDLAQAAEAYEKFAKEEDYNPEQSDPSEGDVLDTIPSYLLDSTPEATNWSERFSADLATAMSKCREDDLGKSGEWDEAKEEPYGTSEGAACDQNEVFTSTDYREYRRTLECITEKDLEELGRLTESLQRVSTLPLNSVIPSTSNSPANNNHPSAEKTNELHLLPSAMKGMEVETNSKVIRRDLNDAENLSVISESTTEDTIKYRDYDDDEDYRWRSLSDEPWEKNELPGHLEEFEVMDSTGKIGIETWNRTELMDSWSEGQSMERLGSFNSLRSGSWMRRPGSGSYQADESWPMGPTDTPSKDAFFPDSVPPVESEENTPATTRTDPSFSELTPDLTEDELDSSAALSASAFMTSSPDVGGNFFQAANTPDEGWQDSDKDYSKVFEHEVLEKPTTLMPRGGDIDNYSEDEQSESPLVSSRSETITVIEAEIHKTQSPALVEPQASEDNVEGHKNEVVSNGHLHLGSELNNSEQRRYSDVPPPPVRNSPAAASAESPLPVTQAETKGIFSAISTKMSKGYQMISMPILHRKDSKEKQPQHNEKAFNEERNLGKGRASSLLNIGSGTLDYFKLGRRGRFRSNSVRSEGALSLDEPYEPPPPSEPSQNVVQQFSLPEINEPESPAFQKTNNSFRKEQQSDTFSFSGYSNSSSLVSVSEYSGTDVDGLSPSHRPQYETQDLVDEEYDSLAEGELRPVSREDQADEDIAEDDIPFLFPKMGDLKRQNSGRYSSQDSTGEMDIPPSASVESAFFSCVSESRQDSFLSEYGSLESPESVRISCDVRKKMLRDIREQQRSSYISYGSDEWRDELSDETSLSDRQRAPSDSDHYETEETHEESEKSSVIAQEDLKDTGDTGDDAEPVSVEDHQSLRSAQSQESGEPAEATQDAEQAGSSQGSTKNAKRKWLALVVSIFLCAR